DSICGDLTGPFLTHQRTKKLLVFKNMLAFRPLMGQYTTTTNYPIECAFERCLVDKSSRFLPRSDSSFLLLQLQAFKFAMDSEVYLHCKLVVWDPDDLNEEKKACNFNRDLGKWELLDDPFQNDLCRCCDSGCRTRKQSFQSEPKELAQRRVLGPLVINSSTSNNDSNQSAFLGKDYS
ncbi:hypothetical protein P4O66_007432, partial [Electrophorus voltai]